MKISLLYQKKKKKLLDSKEYSPDSDDVNLQVIYPSTPAQYFHALRRQIVRDFRKPLVIVGPKTLLRLSDVTSSYHDFMHGKVFQPVIEDTIAMETSKVKRVILCSGKHYYNLNAYRNENKIAQVAIIRVESLCPFPVKEINEQLDKYENAKGKQKKKKHFVFYLLISCFVLLSILIHLFIFDCFFCRVFIFFFHFFRIYLVTRRTPEYGCLEFYKTTL